LKTHVGFGSGHIPATPDWSHADPVYCQLGPDFSGF